jgi:hypothetical protein
VMTATVPATMHVQASANSAPAGALGKWCLLIFPPTTSGLGLGYQVGVIAHAEQLLGLCLCPQHAVHWSTGKKAVNTMRKAAKENIV